MICDILTETEKEKQMTERKLATIRKIAAIEPIEGADAIEVAVVDGWKVVVKKGEFAVDSLAVYLEIDSWVPTELAPFLSKGKEPREYEGIKGERLRTVKLRGQLSQGLLLPLSTLGEPEETFAINEDSVGADVTEQLGILKWERPMNAQLAGMARGNFPALVPKTDQERIQNLTRSFEQMQQDSWSITEKLDGSSCTFYLDDEGVFHVCSRNLDLKEDEANSFWKVARKFQIEDIMRRNSMLGMAIQGEMIGEGIQGNQYKVQLDFYVYDMYNTHTGQYILPVQLKAACEKLGLKHVPILAEATEIKEQTIQSLLEYAEGKSELNGSVREGVVFKSNTVHDRSFKAINNKWLLKNE
jgi:RNA ligase (TIGR02306 family)